MESRDVLLVSSNRRTLDLLPGVLGGRMDSQVVPFRILHEALEELGRREYKSAICVVESSDELACVIRIKKARPDLPVVMLTPSGDPTLRNLAEQLGADAVVRQEEGLEKAADLIALALETRAVTGRQRRSLADNAALVRDIRRLSDQNRELVQRAMGLAASVQPGDFVTLLVEDEPSDMLLLVQALRRAKLPPFVRAVNNVSQAIEYLSGAGAHADRLMYPLPSLIISDLDLGKKSGLDLLRWVRNEPGLSHLGFILFTSSESEEDMKEAALLNANFYIIKSHRLGALVDVVRSVYENCQRFKTT